MRAVLLGLALLAALKIWVQDTAYRTATEHALLAAYRERANTSCQSATPDAARTSPLALAIDWSRQQEATIEIGNSALAIYPWQIDHDRWMDRFRKAYLIVKAPDAGLSCAYDLNVGKAEISPL